MITVRIDWNPANSAVIFTQSAADAVSAPLVRNSTWSPSATIVGMGSAQLILGTSSSLAPGIYAVNISGAGPLGTNIQKISIEVGQSAASFDSEAFRRREFGVFGPEMIPPYRGGDGFFYQPRVESLLQWRPDKNTYYSTNSSELLDLSSIGPNQFRLPQTIREDGSGGDWEAAARIRQGWITDPRIRSRFLSPPPNYTGRWDINGSIILYGLPSSKPQQFGPYVVQRFQRAVFRHWVASTPGHPNYQDTVAVIPLHQALLTYMPEIDPVAALGIATGSKTQWTAGVQWILGNRRIWGKRIRLGRLRK